MTRNIIKISFLLAGAVYIFGLGFLIGSTFCRINRNSHVVYSSSSSSSIKSHKTSELIKEQLLKSFSFAYNTTHLWSMLLADENYYRIARLIPCRTVEYVGGPKKEPMNFCDESVINEFSVEATVQAQKWIYEHQHPANCADKKFAILHQFAWSGFGSTIHQIVWAFGTALGEDRIAIYETPGNWLYGSCELGTPDCIFLPITNCSINSAINNTQTIRIKANVDHWVKPIHPPVFQNRSFNWYRSQLLFYLMRYNSETLNHVHRTVAQYFNPPSVDLQHPYIAVYIRRSDKVAGGEMKQAYRLHQYFDLFDGNVHQANISTVYLNSEDENVFSEFDQFNKNKGGYYKLLSVNATRDVVFGSLIQKPMGERGKIVLEFLTDLFIEANADIHAGTLTSNWCRLVDEMRLVLGKIIPYYTPENRFLIDV